jgi:L-amino acid N-acyltransferase YncA
VTLRPATADDFAFFFRLKCDVDNVVWSGHTEPPKWLHLKAWYYGNTQENSLRTILIGECGDRRVGYAYVDDHSDHTTLTISLITSEGGRGLGSAILEQVIERQKQTEDHRPLTAWIFTDNRPGVRLFEGAGFVLDRARPARKFRFPWAYNQPREQLFYVRREATSLGSSTIGTATASRPDGYTA